MLTVTSIKDLSEKEIQTFMNENYHIIHEWFSDRGMELNYHQCGLCGKIDTEMFYGTPEGTLLTCYWCETGYFCDDCRAPGDSGGFCSHQCAVLWYEDQDIPKDAKLAFDEDDYQKFLNLTLDVTERKDEFDDYIYHKIKLNEQLSKVDAPDKTEIESKSESVEINTEVKSENEVKLSEAEKWKKRYETLESHISHTTGDNIFRCANEECTYIEIVDDDYSDLKDVLMMSSCDQCADDSQFPDDYVLSEDCKWYCVDCTDKFLIYDRENDIHKCHDCNSK